MSTTAQFPVPMTGFQEKSLTNTTKEATRESPGTSGGSPQRWATEPGPAIQENPPLDLLTRMDDFGQVTTCLGSSYISEIKGLN